MSMRNVVVVALALAGEGCIGSGPSAAVEACESECADQPAPATAGRDGGHAEMDETTSAAPEISGTYCTPSITWTFELGTVLLYHRGIADRGVVLRSDGLLEVAWTGACELDQLGGERACGLVESWPLTVEPGAITVGGVRAVACDGFHLPTVYR